MAKHERKIYIGQTFRWDFTAEWRAYVDLAKRYGCRFQSDKKCWQIPNFSTAVELVRSLLEMVPADSIEVTDFETGTPANAAFYITENYLRVRSGIGNELPLRCTVGPDGTFVAMPLDARCRPVTVEHELYRGLAEDGCDGKWVPDRGFRLDRFSAEAVDFLVRDGVCPVAGVPKIFETPFVVDTYEDRIMPHQRDGVTFLAARRFALLGDDMGLGKTMQAIVAAEHLRAEGRQGSGGFTGAGGPCAPTTGLLIVCPVSLIGNWRRELAMWECSYDAKNLFIVPYSQLDKLKAVEEMFPKGRGLVVIADEAHYLKTPTSQRTKAMTEFLRVTAPEVAAAWFLTGTPVTRDFSNLWPLADMMRHPVAEKFMPAQMKDMATRNILRLSGAMRTHMLVRKKSEVLDLPEKIRQVRQTDTGLERLLNLKELEMLAYGKDEDAMEHLMTLKRLTAEAKVDETIEMAQNVLNEGRKVVIFSDHTKSIDRMAASLHGYGAVVLDGRTPQKQRTGIVDKFQVDPKCRVFIGNIKAAGVGITLTAAQDVVFNDFTWLPADMHQAEDRCHRIGATGTVNVYYLADCNLILDDILSRKLAERSAEIATFEQSQQAILKEIRAWAKDRLTAAKTARAVKAAGG